VTDSNTPGGPALIDLSERKKSLWAIERNDGRGWVTWDDHVGKRDFGDAPIPFLLMWTDEDKAAEYAEKELRGTGFPRRIRKDNVIPFLRKILVEARVKYVWLNRLPLEVAETRSGVHGMTKIADLISYLSGGGRIAGERRSR
jgi:hypothetical protein